MKLEDQLCTLEQAKKLKDLGIDQTTQWFWCYPIHPKLISSKQGVIHSSVVGDYLSDNEGDEFDHAVSCAYTVAELSALLPYRLRDEARRENPHLIIYRGMDDWSCEYHHTFSPPYAKSDGHTHLAHSLAQLLINLLESKLVTPEECNKRLS